MFKARLSQTDYSLLGDNKQQRHVPIKDCARESEDGSGVKELTCLSFAAFLNWRPQVIFKRKQTYTYRTNILPMMYSTVLTDAMLMVVV